MYMYLVNKFSLSSDKYIGPAGQKRRNVLYTGRAARISVRKKASTDRQTDRPTDIRPMLYVFRYGGGERINE